MRLFGLSLDVMHMQAKLYLWQFLTIVCIIPTCTILRKVLLSEFITTAD